MSELRWILVIAGGVLLVAIYVFGVRARRRSANPAVERITPRETPRPSTRQEPRVAPEPGDEDEAAVAFPGPAAAQNLPRAPAAEAVRSARRQERAPEHESGPEPEPEPEEQPVHGSGSRRREPTLGDDLESIPDQEPRPMPGMSARRGDAGDGAGDAALRTAPAERPAKTATADAAVKSRSKIVALRVSAPLPTRFGGAQLMEALQAERLEFGRFDIFHRLDEQGRPVFSLANLLEPGTFDLATIQEGAYPGVALFAVLPGPLPAIEAFDQLVATAKALAARLGGSLQDERGAWLSAQRIASLREELLAGETSPGPGGGA
jgi:cell division protein ZipA